VVAFKTVTVVFAIAVLYRLRRRVQGEVGTWLAMLVLATVCVQWVRYADEVLDLDQAGLQQLAQTDPNWVQFQ